MDIREIIDASGYPLQIHLTDLIETNPKLRWRILTREHLWVDTETHAEGYIDLVLGYGNKRLVIECKRIIGDWVFMLPSHMEYKTAKTRFLQAEFDPSHNGWNWKWIEQRFSPETYRSAYCVMETDGKKDSRTLEKLSKDVLLSLESFAQEESKSWVSSTTKRLGYLPAIVTTAKLQVCIFDPRKVNIENGRIPRDEDNLVDVDFIRFQKGLPSNLRRDMPVETIEEADLESERTVFVIQASKFAKFLMAIID